MSIAYDCEFTPLFKQICIQDCYRLKQLPFVPDVILDIGANIGVFTSYVRFLFPKADIVAVEPNLRNRMLLRDHTAHFPKIIYMRAALGTGKIWRAKRDIEPPWYGAMESYITEPHGTDLGQNDAYERTDIPETSLADLVGSYSFPPWKTLLVKIDAEGGENCIFDHPPSMNALRQIDHLVMETHSEPGTPISPEDSSWTIGDALMSLSETHTCVLEPEHHYFHATKKEYA